MIDRENVIKGLEGMIDYFFDIYRNDTDSYKCAKAQEYSDCAIDAIAILKEQEAVEPVNIRWEMGINGGNCPKCMNWVQRTYNYCPFCGKAVKWE